MTIATVRREIEAHIKARNVSKLLEEKVKLHIYALPIANRVRQESREQLDYIMQTAFLDGYEGSERRAVTRH